MSDTRHNGWANYPTWAVNLWLANDEGLYNETRDMARAAIDGDHPTSKYWTVEESRRFNLADAIKAWVTDDLAPDLDASFASDLLGYALDQVDWHEIADSWLAGEDDA